MDEILVLGGSGFIGKNLCNYLAERGYKVICYDRNEFITNSKNIRFVVGDFFDDNMLYSAVKKVKYVIHAISSINPGNSNELFMRGYEKDFIQTLKLCNWLVGKDIRMIFISSGGTVYGEHAIQPLSEIILPRPINHYGNIKLSIENAMRAFNYQMKTSFLIARVSNPYGRGNDIKKGVGFIDTVIKKALSGEKIEIWGDGENIRDYIYIDDVCKMIESLIRYNGDLETFNISTGIGTTQNQVLEIVRKQGINVLAEYKSARTVDVRTSILANGVIRKISGIKPISVRDGIEVYCRYLLEDVK